MTLSAWLMLIATWTVVLFFTGRFFLKVLRTPIDKAGTGKSAGGGEK